MTDLSIAIDAVRAAADAARAARSAPLRARSKGVSADVVTDADAAAEAAAVAVLRARAPADAVLGEEGTARAGAAGRRWVVDGIDGTVAFANGLVGGWCSAVALEDGAGPLAAAVFEPVSGELFAAARGEGTTVTSARGGRAETSPPTVARLRPPRPLAAAYVATFLRQDRLVLPGVRAIAHALLDTAGLIRHAGPGSLELAWVAAGRLDAWIQPQVDPWDWLPGALLVTEAGGEARVIDAGARWHVAGPRALVDELEALVRAA